jgi:hypothetical protein
VVRQVKRLFIGFTFAPTVFDHKIDQHTLDENEGDETDTIDQVGCNLTSEATVDAVGAWVIKPSAAWIKLVITFPSFVATLSRA